MERWLYTIKKRTGSPATGYTISEGDRYTDSEDEAMYQLHDIAAKYEERGYIIEWIDPLYLFIAWPTYRVTESTVRHFFSVEKEWLDDTELDIIEVKE